jgi:hypothetical protein
MREIRKVVPKNIFLIPYWRFVRYWQAMQATDAMVDQSVQIFPYFVVVAVYQKLSGLHNVHCDAGSNGLPHKLFSTSPIPNRTGNTPALGKDLIFFYWHVVMKPPESGTNF